MKVLRVFLGLAVTLLWSSALASAQTIPGPEAGAGTGQTISGVVLESVTGARVTDARVILTRLSDATEFQAVSDGQGNFLFESATPGRYRLRVEVIGFYPYATQPFALTSSAGTNLGIRLDRAPVALEGVTAYANQNRADFERRKGLSYGTRLGPEALAERRGLSLSEFAAREVPWLEYDLRGGLRTRNPFIYSARASCRPLMFVDGAVFKLDFLPRDAFFELDQWIDTNKVRALEVYPDGGSVPAPFFGLARAENAGRPPCAVIVIWTETGLGM